MANTLNDLIPDALEALDVVSREMVGFIPAVKRDTEANRAAIGETVRFPIAPAESSADNTPGVNAPDTGDAVIGNDTLAITKSKHVPVRWNGEETLGTQRKGIYSTIQADRFAQAFRTLTNEIEADLAATYISSSRAYGTADTTPFGTGGDLSDFAGVNQILDDNGAPKVGRQLVLDSSAIANLRGKQNTLFRVNEAGSDDMLRTGMTDLVQGLALRQSGQVARHTAGTATLFDITGGFVVGDETLTVDGSDAGTILPGDIVTWAGDGNKYVVLSSTASGSASGNIVIGKPGLQETLAVATEGTLGASYTANMAFSQDALVLASRMPAMPEGGDMAEDVTQIQDPFSGLIFELAQYKQYLQNVIHVRIAWGVKAVKPAHMALLLG